MDIQDLANSINGKIFGNDSFFNNQDFTGRFTLLNDSDKGDIVVRHWINAKGIEIAESKGIACLITQNPKDGAIEKASELNFPLIVTDKIELANAYALSYTIERFSAIFFSFLWHDFTIHWKRGESIWFFSCIS